MAPGRNNKIEVDLKLLDDKNREALTAFGKSFNASVERLAGLLGEVTGAVSGGEAAAARPGKTNDAASKASDVKISAPPTPFYSTVGATGANTGNFTGVRTLNPSASVTPMTIGPEMAPGPDGSPMPVGGRQFEKDYIAAQKRIGEIPVGLRQTLGYIAEGELFPGHPTLQKGARWGNEQLFKAQAISANAGRVYGHVQSAFASIAAPTALGQNLGRSREGGLFGTGLFSSAFTTGIEENFKAGLSADFGFNANYSMAQAKAARQAIEQYGYSGDTSDVLAGQLKQLQIHQQLDPGTVMNFLDPYMRYGSAQSGTNLITELQAIPTAAKAAAMNLQTFTQSLTEAADTISQQTGMQPGQLIGALNTFSSVTGLAPTKATQLYTTGNMLQTAALTGTPFSKLYESGAAGGALMTMPLMRLHSMLGMTSEQLEKLRKTDPAAYYAKMSPIDLIASRNPDFFGGFTPQQLINTDLRNNDRTVQHMIVQDKIEAANVTGEPGTMPNFVGLLKSYGPQSGSIVKRYEDAMAKWMKSNPTASRAKTAQAEKAAALSAIGVNQQKQAKKARLEIGLTTQAAKYFKLMTGSTGQANTPDKNQAKNFVRDVKNEFSAKTEVHQVEDLADWVTSW